MTSVAANTSGRGVDAALIAFIVTCLLALVAFAGGAYYWTEWHRMGQTTSTAARSEQLGLIFMVLVPAGLHVYIQRWVPRHQALVVVLIGAVRALGTGVIVRPSLATAAVFCPRTTEPTGRLWHRGGMRVIGAGWGRTGTTSLAAALAHLGVEPCLQMQEVWPHPELAALWNRHLDGEYLDWCWLTCRRIPCFATPARIPALVAVATFVSCRR